MRHGGYWTVGVALHVCVQLHVSPFRSLARNDALNAEGMLSVQVVRLLQLPGEEHTLVKDAWVSQSSTRCIVKIVHVLKMCLVRVVLLVLRVLVVVVVTALLQFALIQRAKTVQVTLINLVRPIRTVHQAIHWPLVQMIVPVVSIQICLSIV